MAHLNFVDIIRQAANEGWGRDFKKPEEAIKELGEFDFQAVASLEVIRRLNQFFRAIAASEEKPNTDWKGVDDFDRPDYAVSRPDAKIGQVFWSCEDLECGASMAFVVAVVDGFPIVSNGTYKPCWLGDEYFDTLEESLAHAAKGDIEYHKPMIDRAKKVLSTIAAKGDLNDFVAK